MRRSINIYFCFISLVISASIFGQNNSIMFGGQNGNIEFNDVTIESGDGIVPTSSTTTQLSLGDALAVAVMNKKKYLKIYQ